jgi:hypothetical protein
MGSKRRAISLISQLSPPLWIKKMQDYTQLTLADEVSAQLQKLLSEPSRSIEQAEKSRLKIRALLELQEFFKLV